jgi:hypothetical protein
MMSLSPITEDRVARPLEPCDSPVPLRFARASLQPISSAYPTSASDVSYML